MSTTTSSKTEIPKGLDARVLARILEEGYGPGAWHGADLKAALADVSPELAFWRPGAGRHNIAEIALHHAYCARSVRGQLSGTTPEPFVLEGEDWFALPAQSAASTGRRSAASSRRSRPRWPPSSPTSPPAAMKSPLADAERFDLVLGVTCHAVYHAGQVQLIKRLQAE